MFHDRQFLGMHHLIVDAGKSNTYLFMPMKDRKHSGISHGSNYILDYPFKS
jgi:hypothetical protein